VRRPSSFKEDRRVQREAKRREKLALKEAPKAERRAERVDPYRGHESQFDPAIPASTDSVGAVARHFSDFSQFIDENREQSCSRETLSPYRAY
jgi:hypothetical protein